MKHYDKLGSKKANVEAFAISYIGVIQFKNLLHSRIKSIIDYSFSLQRNYKALSTGYGYAKFSDSNYNISYI